MFAEAWKWFDPQSQYELSLVYASGTFADHQLKRRLQKSLQTDTTIGHGAGIEEHRNRVVFC
jgi:hypothetical protein